MARVALIDGDEVVYRIAYSCQINEWWVKDIKSGRPLYKCLNKKAAIESIGADDNILDLHCESYIVDNFVQELDNYIKGIIKDAKAKGFRIFLTGDNNFRKELATLLPYKGHRADAEKPDLYDAIRNHLLDEYEAELLDECEADDGLSINQWGSEQLGDTVILSQDKDLDMVPGYHFNPRKGKEYFITPEQGIRWFYTQLLAGDPTDNIPGIYRIGIKTAEKLVAGVKGEKDLYDMVYDEYVKAYSKPNILAKMPGDAPVEKRVLEVARLLWMQQFEGQMWRPECEYSIW